MIEWVTVVLNFHQMTEAEKRLVCQWRYPGQYAVYDLPAFEEAKARGLSIADPAFSREYFAYYYEGQLVGYTRLKEQPDGIFVALGVAPQLCNQGYGQQILSIACDLAFQHTPGKPLFLLVRTWNIRAIRCYEKAGFIRIAPAFTPTERDDNVCFFRMEKKR